MSITTAELRRQFDAAMRSKLMVMPGACYNVLTQVPALLDAIDAQTAELSAMSARCVAAEEWRETALKSIGEIIDGVFTANAYPTVDLHTENPRYQYFVYLHEGEYGRFRKLFDDAAPKADKQGAPT